MIKIERDQYYLSHMACRQMALLLLLLARGTVLATPIGPVNDDYPTSPDYEMGIEGDGDVIDELTDCIEYQSWPGRYQVHRSTPTAEACGLYLVAPVDNRVEITFEQFEVDCEGAGIVEIVDGYAHDATIFPPAETLPDVRRIHKTYCGAAKPVEVFRSTNNMAVIQNRMPNAGDSFQVTVKFFPNPRPCNSLIVADEGTFRLQNYGTRLNCSVLMLFPQSLSLTYFDVASKKEYPKHASQDADYLEILGGNSTSLSRMKIFERLSGYGLRSKMSRNIICNSVIVRLVSSGLFHNFVEVNHKVLAEDPIQKGQGNKEVCWAWSSSDSQ